MNNNNILTPKEKEYFEHFLRPFRNRVLYIKKCCYPDEICYLDICMLGISEHSNKEYISLPYFNIKDMYRGMQPFYPYTLFELGLFKYE